MPKQFWMVKQEPAAYSWGNFVADRGTAWTGIRNFQARNNLRAMKKGDLVFFYHSVTGKEAVGLARVVREHFPDPTAKEGDWSAVQLEPVKPLKSPVTLAQMKDDAVLKEMLLIKHTRLSVIPLTARQAERLARLGGISL